MFSTFWIAQCPVSLCLNEIMYSLVFCFTLLWFQCILIWCCYFIKWFIPKRTTWPSCWAPGQLQVTLRSSCEYHTCSLGSGGWFFFLKFNILKFLHQDWKIKTIRNNLEKKKCKYQINSLLINGKNGNVKGKMERKIKICQLGKDERKIKVRPLIGLLGKVKV